MERVSTQKSLGLSLLVHLLFLITIYILSLNAPNPKEWIQVELLPDKSSTKEAEHRIVQTAKVAQTKESTDARFLSDTNQKVDQQQVSRNKTTQMAKNAATLTKSSESGSKHQTVGVPSVKLSSLGVQVIPKNFGSKELEKLSQDRVLANEEVSQQAQEYVKGFKEGDSTLLNTKEFIFYGYFQRIRERLDYAWNNSLKEHLLKHYRAGRQLASEIDYTTRLLVMLNRVGEIVRVLVLEESGTRTLDDAAVKAFNQAGPFPNPPKGMVDQSGTITVRWDFILKT